MLFARVRAVDGKTEILAAGRGQHFQVRGHSFSLIWKSVTELIYFFLSLR